MLIKVIDEYGKQYSSTYVKRANGLVKNKRAYWVDDNHTTICLVSPSINMEEKQMETKQYEKTLLILKVNYDILENQKFTTLPVIKTLVKGYNDILITLKNSDFNYQSIFDLIDIDQFIIDPKKPDQDEINDLKEYTHMEYLRLIKMIELIISENNKINLPIESNGQNTQNKFETTSDQFNFSMENLSEEISQTVSQAVNLAFKALKNLSQKDDRVKIITNNEGVTIGIDRQQEKAYHDFARQMEEKYRKKYEYSYDDEIPLKKTISFVTDKGKITLYPIDQLIEIVEDNDWEYSRVFLSEIADNITNHKVYEIFSPNTLKVIKKYRKEFKKFISQLTKDNAHQADLYYQLTEGYEEAIENLGDEIKDCQEELEQLDSSDSRYQEIIEQINGYQEGIKAIKAKLDDLVEKPFPKIDADLEKIFDKLN